MEGLRWALASANREETVPLLAERLGIAQDVAAATYRRAIDPAGGLTPDARLDLEGFRAVLALRAELEGYAEGRVPPVDRDYESQYYQRALDALGPCPR